MGAQLNMLRGDQPGVVGGGPLPSLRGPALVLGRKGSSSEEGDIPGLQGWQVLWCP